MRKEHRIRPLGFTLIELMIVLSIVAVLAVLAIPNIAGWVANSKVRTVAESLQNDLRAAQAEAVSRGRQVVFVLTADTPPTGTTPNATGPNWYWDVVPMTSSAETLTYVKGNSIATQYSVTLAGDYSALCFNSMGRLVTNTVTIGGTNVACAIPAGAALASFTVTQTKADRPLQVSVQQGGRVRLCDPAKTLSTDHPDGC
jgi:type IV fimbrial biogenesis protein FimT